MGHVEHEGNDLQYPRVCSHEQVGEPSILGARVGTGQSRKNSPNTRVTTIHPTSSGVLDRSGSWPPASGRKHVSRTMGHHLDRLSHLRNHRTPEYLGKTSNVRPADLDSGMNKCDMQMDIPGISSGDHDPLCRCPFNTAGQDGSVDQESLPVNWFGEAQPAYTQMPDVGLSFAQRIDLQALQNSGLGHIDERKPVINRVGSPSSSTAPKRMAGQRHDNTPLRKKSKTSSTFGDTEEKDADASGDEDQRNSTNGRAFACPFYIRSPSRNRDCVNRKLRRIRDVKQHILRRHVQGGTIYCPACYMNFSSSSQRDEHIRFRGCEPRAAPPAIDPLETISQETQAELFRHRASRGLSPESQWHAIWKILFRNDSKAVNPRPYMRTVMEETVGLIRDFWVQESPHIAPAFLENKGIEVPKDVDVSGLVMGLFDEFCRRFEQKSLCNDLDQGLDKYSVNGQNRSNSRDDAGAHEDFPPEFVTLENVFDNPNFDSYVPYDSSSFIDQLMEPALDGSHGMMTNDFGLDSLNSNTSIFTDEDDPQAAFRMNEVCAVDAGDERTGFGTAGSW